MYEVFFIEETDLNRDFAGYWVAFTDLPVSKWAFSNGFPMRPVDAWKCYKTREEAESVAEQLNEVKEGENDA